jgi:molybdopterin-guanine dinucleotide biosynthesis protein A
MGQLSYPCVGVVLAGGKSLRFGSPKAFASWGGKTFVERVYGLLEDVFGRCYVALHKPSPKFSGMKTVLDQWPKGGAMNGIYSALKATQAEAIFVLGCDMPLVQRADILNLYRKWRPEFPALVGQLGGIWEPLFGIYSKQLLPALQAMRQGKGCSLSEFLTQIHARKATVSGRAVTNINTLKDFLKAKAVSRGN